MNLIVIADENSLVRNFVSCFAPRNWWNKSGSEALCYNLLSFDHISHQVRDMMSGRGTINNPRTHNRPHSFNQNVYSQLWMVPFVFLLTTVLYLQYTPPMTSTGVPKSPSSLSLNTHKVRTSDSFSRKWDAFNWLTLKLRHVKFRRLIWTP